MTKGSSEGCQWFEKRLLFHCFNVVWEDRSISNGWTGKEEEVEGRQIGEMTVTLWNIGEERK